MEDKFDCWWRGTSELRCQGWIDKGFHLKVQGRCTRIMLDSITMNFELFSNFKSPDLEFFSLFIP